MQEWTTILTDRPKWVQELQKFLKFSVLLFSQINLFSIVFFCNFCLDLNPSLNGALNWTPAAIALRFRPCLSSSTPSTIEALAHHLPTLLIWFALIFLMDTIISSLYNNWRLLGICLLNLSWEIEQKNENEILLSLKLHEERETGEY